MISHRLVVDLHVVHVERGRLLAQMLLDSSLQHCDVISAVTEFMVSMCSKT
jgi:hypothetical protein